MSNTIRHYPSISRFVEAEEMRVSATMQGVLGAGVQFTIGHKFCVLAENQVRDLVEALRQRLEGRAGYRATDDDMELHVEPRDLP